MGGTGRRGAGAWSTGGATGPREGLQRPGGSVSQGRGVPKPLQQGSPGQSCSQRHWVMPGDASGCGGGVALPHSAQDGPSVCSARGQGIPCRLAGKIPGCAPAHSRHRINPQAQTVSLAAPRPGSHCLPPSCSGWPLRTSVSPGAMGRQGGIPAASRGPSVGARDGEASEPWGSESLVTCAPYLGGPHALLPGPPPETEF